MSGSAGGGEVIREFLVRLGYEEHGRKNFSNSLIVVASEAVELGEAVAGAAKAVLSFVAQVSAGLDNLYYTSRRTGASVENIKAMGYAVAQMGGTVEGATSSLESMGRFLRTQPGAEGFLQSLGVQTRTIGLQIRDTADLTGDLFKRLATMPAPQQYAIANIFGIDEKTLLAGITDLGKYQDTLHAMYAAAGYDAQKAAADSRGFQNEIKTLGLAFQTLSELVVSNLSAKMGNNIRRFREALVANFGTISRAITWVAEKLVAAADVIATLAIKTVTALRDLAAWFTSLDSATKEVLVTLAEAAVAFRILFAVFAMSPAGLIVALGAAILGLVDDYNVWKRTGGQGSLIDWSQWEPAFVYAKAAILDLKGPLVALKNAIVDDFWPAIRDFVTSFKGAFADFSIKAQIDAAKDEIKGLIEWFEKGVKGVSHWIDWLTALKNFDVEGMNKAQALIIADQKALWQGVDRQVAGVEEGLMGGAPGTPGREERSPAGKVWDAAKEWLGIGGGAQPTAHPAAGARVDKQAQAKEAYQFWLGKGYTPSGAAGMVAQEQHESGFDPAARGDPNKAGVMEAAGLFQWHADRRKRIRDTLGIDVTTATAQQQREAMYQEQARGLDPQSGQAYQIIKNARDIQTAVDAGVDLVERPKDRGINKRVRGITAQEWAGRLAGVAAAPAAPGDQAAMERARGLPPGALDGLMGPVQPNGGAAFAPVPVRPSRGVGDIEFLRGLTPGTLGGLENPAPLLPGNVSNTNAPVITQTTTITVNGAAPDAGRQVIDGQREVNQDMQRNLQGAQR